MKDPINPVPENIRKIIEQQHKLLGKVSPYLKHINNEYGKVRGFYELGDRLRLSISAFEESPTRAQLNKLRRITSDLKKAKEELDFNAFYQLSQFENNELQTENDSIKKELESLKKLNSDYADRIKYADFIIENYAKKTKIKKPDQLTLKPNFTDPDWQILKLFENSKELFESSIDQWRNLFSDNINVFNDPIKLKPGTTISELRYLLEMLMQKRFIKKRGALKTIEKARAFSFDNDPITSKQLRDALKTINNPFFGKTELVDRILDTMKLD